MTEISLLKGASLERYRIHITRVADALYRFAIRDFSADIKRLHNITVLLSALAPFAHIRTSKKVVVEEYMDYWKKRSRGEVVSDDDD